MINLVSTSISYILYLAAGTYLQRQKLSVDLAKPLNWQPVCGIMRHISRYRLTNLSKVKIQAKKKKEEEEEGS